MEDRDPDVVIQAMLTLNLHKIPDSDKMIRAAAATTVRGVREIGTDPSAATSQGQRPSLADTAVSAFNDRQTAARCPRRGRLQEVCAACHAPDGAGAPMAGAPEGTRRRRSRGRLASPAIATT